MSLPAFSLNRASRESLYSQLVKELEDAIESGKLTEGERLPSERNLAAQLGLSRTTIINSYRELESRGLVRSHVGRGTFVCATSKTVDAPFAWRGKVAAATAEVGTAPAVRDLMRHVSNPNLISFALLLPALECFPLNEYRRAMDHAISSYATEGLGVVPPEGHPRLRGLIANRFGVKLEQVLVLSGAQQGLDLVARCLLEPGDTVIIDRPGYVGAIENFRAAGAKMIGWDVGRSDLGELEDLLLRYRPKLICTNPTFQNPTGRTLSLRERKDLLALTSRYRVPVIEDDPYQDTWLSTPPPPTLYQLDKSNTVIHLGTFSKSLSPGLRLGWLLASEYVVDQLALIKERQILFSGGLEQIVMAELLRNGTYDRHLTRLREEHVKRRDMMNRALEQHMPPRSLVLNHPAGGLHFWARLINGVESQSLSRVAISNGVAIAAGEIFYADVGAGRHEFRLCFTSSASERIEEGIKRLASALKEAKAESSRLDSLATVI